MRLMHILYGLVFNELAVPEKRLVNGWQGIVEALFLLELSGGNGASSRCSPPLCLCHHIKATELNFKLSISTGALLHNKLVSARKLRLWMWQAWHVLKTCLVTQQSFAFLNGTTLGEPIKYVLCISYGGFCLSNYLRWCCKLRKQEFRMWTLLLGSKDSGEV